MSGNYRGAVNPEFAARLARVEAGGMGTNRTVFVGIDEAFCVPRNRSVLAVANSKTSVRSSITPAALLALVLGIFSVGLAQYLRFRFLPDLKLEAEIESLANLAASGVIALVLTRLCNLKGVVPLMAQSFAVFAGVCSFHNLVHHYPQVFYTVFSPEWVTTVTNTTDPDTIVFRGVSYSIKT